MRPLCVVQWAFVHKPVPKSEYLEDVSSIDTQPCGVWVDVLKKYSLAAGERNQVKNVAIVVV